MFDETTTTSAIIRVSGVNIIGDGPAPTNPVAINQLGARAIFYVATIDIASPATSIVFDLEEADTTAGPFTSVDPESLIIIGEVEPPYPDPYIVTIGYIGNKTALNLQVNTTGLTDSILSEVLFLDHRLVSPFLQFQIAGE